MIVDAASHTALSSLGWVDHGSLWSLAVDSQTPRHIEVSDAKYLAVARSTDGGRFAVTHHYDGRRWAITVHEFADPPTVVAEVTVDGWRPKVRGDLSTFAQLPRVHITYLDDTATGAAGYYLIDLTGTADEVRRLDWFTADDYDLVYQGVISVLEIPGAGYLFSVQRSSNLVHAIHTSKCCE